MVLHCSDESTLKDIKAMLHRFVEGDCFVILDDDGEFVDLRLDEIEE